MSTYHVTVTVEVEAVNSDEALDAVTGVVAEHGWTVGVLGIADVADVKAARS